jgi:NAD-dependent dihydropyrimidine dehydrogenase PreA subunit
VKYFKDSDTFSFNAEKCTGCGRCVEVCPHEVFIMENRKAVAVNSARCMECGACAKNCDFDAIYVKSGVGCAAAVINGLIRGTEPNCDCSGPSGACC